MTVWIDFFWVTSHKSDLASIDCANITQFQHQTNKKQVLGRHNFGQGLRHFQNSCDRWVVHLLQLKISWSWVKTAYCLSLHNFSASHSWTWPEQTEFHAWYFLGISSLAGMWNSDCSFRFKILTHFLFHSFRYQKRKEVSCVFHFCKSSAIGIFCCVRRKGGFVSLCWAKRTINFGLGMVIPMPRHIGTLVPEGQVNCLRFRMLGSAWLMQ